MLGIIWHLIGFSPATTASTIHRHVLRDLCIEKAPLLLLPHVEPFVCYFSDEILSTCESRIRSCVPPGVSLDLYITESLPAKLELFHSTLEHLLLVPDSYESNNPSETLRKPFETAVAHMPSFICNTLAITSESKMAKHLLKIFYLSDLSASSTYSADYRSLSSTALLAKAEALRRSQLGLPALSTGVLPKEAMNALLDIPFEISPVLKTLCFGVSVGCEDLSRRAAAAGPLASSQGIQQHLRGHYSQLTDDGERNNLFSEFAIGPGYSGVHAIPKVLLRGLLAADRLEYPLMARLARRLNDLSIKMIEEELKFLDTFVPVLKEVRVMCMESENQASCAYLDSFLLEIPTFSIPTQSITPELNYAAGLVKLYLPFRISAASFDCQAILLPEYFNANLANSDCVLRLTLFVVAANIPFTEISDSLAKMEPAIRGFDATVRSIFPSRDVYAELQAAESLLGLHASLMSGLSAESQANEPGVLERSLSKYVLAGRLALGEVPKEESRSMRSRIYYLSSRNAEEDFAKWDNVHSVVYRVNYDKQAELEIIAAAYKDLSLLEILFLIDGGPSLQLLHNRWQEFRGLFGLPKGSSERVYRPEGTEIVELDPMGVYLCSYGVQVACEGVQDKRKSLGEISEEVLALVRQSLRSSSQFLQMEHEEFEKDVNFVRELMQADPLPMEPAGIVHVHFFTSAELKWPLMHRILRGTREGNVIQDIVDREIEIYERNVPFLLEVDSVCEYEQMNEQIKKACAERYEKFLTYKVPSTTDRSPTTLGRLFLSPGRGGGLLEKSEQTIRLARQNWEQLKTEPADPDFPTALENLPIQRLPELEGILAKVRWVRLPDVISQTHDTVTLFGDISPGQFTQGNVGDCWFMATAGCAAEYADPVREWFVEDSVQEGGKYVVRIRDSNDKQWKSVEVNDLVPCVFDENTGKWQPIFAKLEGNAMWPALYEKATAKFRGSYGALDGGHGINAMDFFSEAAKVTFVREYGRWKNKSIRSSCIKKGMTLSNDAFVKELAKLGNRKYIMTASIPGAGESSRPDGLLGGHEYALLRIVDVPVDMHDNKVETLVQIWEPYRKHFWKDNNKTYNMKSKGNKRSEDGRFWMPAAEFAEIFSRVDVLCRPTAETCDITL